jgi:hypothetical protein
MVIFGLNIFGDAVRDLIDSRLLAPASIDLY